MNLFTFIYIVGIYVILNLFQGFKQIDLNDQLIYSSIFILLIGIPHGAIDHILLFKKRKISEKNLSRLIFFINIKIKIDRKVKILVT
jgi:hypothetical protein